jgi:hypothetical protein
MCTTAIIRAMNPCSHEVHRRFRGTSTWLITRLYILEDSKLNFPRCFCKKKGTFTKVSLSETCVSVIPRTTNHLKTAEGLSGSAYECFASVWRLWCGVLQMVKIWERTAWYQYCTYLGAGSSVSIVPGYWLDDRAIEVRSPAKAKDFSSNLCVQTGSEARPASCTMGTGVLSPDVKRGRDVTLTSHPHLVPR